MNFQKIKSLLISTISIILLFTANNLYAQDCNITVSVVPTPAVCASDGYVTFSITGADVSYFDLENAQYKIQSVGPGYSTPFAKNPDMTIRDLVPGNYTVFVRGFCTKAGVEITKQSLSVTIKGTYENPNMYVADKEVRKTLNCKVTGMIPVYFNKGKAPYKAVLTSYPPEYTGLTEFTQTTTGKLEINNLPSGNYSLELSDDCGYTMPLTTKIEKVASDFPTITFSNSSAYLISGETADCKTLRTTPTTSIATDHELYYYWTNKLTYYDMYVSEDSAPALYPCTWWNSSEVKVTLHNLTYKDIYPAGGTSFPAGGHIAYMQLKVKDGTGDCVSAQSVLNIRRPYASGLFFNKYTCTGANLYTSQWADYDGVLCYPYRVDAYDNVTNALVLSKTGITTNASTLIGELPYGNYKIIFTGTDGGQWARSSGTVAAVNHNYPNYNVSYTSLTTCPENGNTGSLKIYPIAYSNCFIEGTIIKFVSGPTGQDFPDIIVNDTITGAIYPYGSTGKVPPGVYEFKVIDPCGVEKPLKITVNPIVLTYYTTSGSDYCLSSINKSYGYIYTSDNNPIPGGSTFTFRPDLSTGNPASVAHPNITIPTGTSRFFNPFNLSDYTSSNTYLEGIDPGNYVFDVWDAFCRQTVRVTIVMPKKYTVKDFAYTKEYTCTGLKVTPSGTMQLGGVNTTTYYRISLAKSASGTSITNFDKSVIKPGGYLLLQENGTYVIQISYYSSTGSCASSTISVDYEQPAPKLDYAQTASYVCGGKSSGYIKLVAAGGFGSGPYRYEIKGTSLSNTTGIFNYGTPNETVTINITDESPVATTLGCRPTFQQKVTMLDLSDASIAYTSNNGNFCEGSTIDLSCVTLGTTTYKWTGPNGFTSTSQYPSIPNASTSMSGLYTVTVTPENCGEELIQSVLITVHPTPESPILTNTNIELCQQASITYTSATGVSSLPNHTLKWYDSDEVTEITVSNIATSIVGTKTYYVSQVNNTTKCESPLVPFSVTTLPLPLAPVVPTPDAKCYGDPVTFTINPTNSNYTYNLYLNNSSGGTPIDTKQGNGALITLDGGTFTNLRYYISTVNAKGCESNPRASSVIALSPSGIANDIISDNDTICTGGSTTLTVTSIGITNPIYRWYNGNSASATLLHTGDTFITPTLTSSYTYYYVSVQGVDLCENTPSTRKLVIVRALSRAYSSYITGASQTICEGSLTSITVTSPYVTVNPVFRWYTSQTESTPFFIGDTYTTPTLNLTTTYYISVSNTTQYCENLINNRKAITITVNQKGVGTATDICPGASGLISISNAKSWVTYQIYNAATGGVLQGSGSRSGNGILNIALSSSYTKDTLLFIQTVDGYCNSSARTPVSLNIKTVSLQYPDIRTQICPTSGHMVNLNSYLDMFDVSKVIWSSTGSTSIVGGNSINAGNLKPKTIYRFNYNITNSCVTTKGSLYIEAIGDRGIRPYVDTIKYCKDNAQHIQPKQALGIEVAGGTWNYNGLDSYISNVNGAILFNGKQAWLDNQGVPYPPVARARMIEFTYTVPAGTCSTNATTFKLIIVLTEDILTSY